MEKPLITSIRKNGKSVYLSDCRDVLKTLDDKSVDYVLTSPPYNRKRNDKYDNYDDNIENWYEFNIEVITELLRVTKKHIFYNIQANYYNRRDVYNIIGHFSDKIVDIHIWEKSNPMPASGKSITNAVEYFIILGNTSLKSNTTYTKNILTTSVNNKMPKEHRAVMKREVAYHFIDKFTKEGDLILDPFFGVGTTGVVCNELNRKFIGIEKIEDYFNMSVDNCIHT